MKTGLNNMKMKMYITASLKRISFTNHFLKTWEDFNYSCQRYGLLNHTGSAFSLYEVIKVGK